VRVEAVLRLAVQADGYDGTVLAGVAMERPIEETA
jgi:hypothetical protein